MLIVSLSAIYQGVVSILPSSQRHDGQLSRMHLRYVIMGELTLQIDKILTHLSDHVNNADPEPFNEHCSARGTVRVSIATCLDNLRSTKTILKLRIFR
jgi:hypothetical protein